jgi:hypothetical protein
VLLGNQLIAEIYEKYNENKVYIFKKSLQGPLRVLTFVDLAIYSSFNKKTNKFSMFERLFGNKSITFKDGKKVLQTEQINPKFIPLVKSQKIPIFVTTEPPVDGYPGSIAAYYENYGTVEDNAVQFAPSDIIEKVCNTQLSNILPELFVVL